MPKLKFLVVDDEEGYRDIVKQYLVLHGCDVVACKNIKEAEEAIRTYYFDKALVDVFLPYNGAHSPDGVDDGIEFIRKYSKKSKTKFYILTTSIDDPRIIKALDKNSFKFDGYIKKMELVEWLREAASDVAP